MEVEGGAGGGMEMKAACLQVQCYLVRNDLIKLPWHVSQVWR